METFKHLAIENLKYVIGIQMVGMKLILLYLSRQEMAPTAQRPLLKGLLAPEMKIYHLNTKHYGLVNQQMLEIWIKKWE